MLTIKFPTFTPKNNLNIILHIVILFIILSLLFKYYISNTTITTFNNSIDNIIDGLIYNLKNEVVNKFSFFNNIINNLNDVKNINNINNNIYNYYYNLFSKEDLVKKISNEKIFFYITFVNVLLIIVFLVLTLIYLHHKLITIDDIKLILLENVITFIFVGFVEYLFFTRVAIKYSPVTQEEIYSRFLNSFKDKLSNN